MPTDNPRPFVKGEEKRRGDSHLGRARAHFVSELPHTQLSAPLGDGRTLALSAERCELRSHPEGLVERANGLLETSFLTAVTSPGRTTTTPSWTPG